MSAAATARSRTGRRRRGRLRPWVLAAGGAVAVLVLLQALVVQSFSVPSASMAPTIEPGDRLLANRLVRGPSVRRGDVVVLDGARTFSGQPSSLGQPSAGGPLRQLLSTGTSLLSLGAGTDYVKRVVGVPGDRVSCCDPSGRLVVNGVGVSESYLFPGDRGSDATFDVTVPVGRIWVMGDHRSDSVDSRSFLGRPGGGMVWLDDVVGQVTVRYWPPGRLGSLPEAGPLSTIPPMPGAGH